MNENPTIGRALARIAAGAGALGLTLLVAASASAGAPAGGPTVAHDGPARSDGIDVQRYVVPPNGRVGGRTIDEWIGDLWQWTFTFLEGESPVFDDPSGELAYEGDVGGPVFFAAAASDVQRRFDVRCGQHMLIPLADIAWTLEGTDTEAFAREQTAEFVASVTSLTAKLDGRRIRGLWWHAHSSPDLFPVTIPDGGLFGPEGGSFEAVAAGYFLMLKPLPRGKHTLVFGATALDGAFDYRARFDFRVVGQCPRS